VIKQKRSKIVKLRLPSHLLARVRDSKKRKLATGNGDEDRPPKRQSFDTGSLVNGNGATKSGLVKVEKSGGSGGSGGETRRLVLRMKVGKANLPGPKN